MNEPPAFTNVGPCGYCGKRVAVFGATWRSMYPVPSGYPWYALHEEPRCLHWPEKVYNEWESSKWTDRTTIPSAELDALVSSPR